MVGVWKNPIINEKTIKLYLRSVVELFGEPVAYISDMGNRMMVAISSLIREMRLKFRQLVCHMHILKALGKSILQKTIKTLISLFRDMKTLADLNRIAKDAGGIISPQATAICDYVVRW